jgi:RNA polymerase-interacting CarD/CdnL/TRCF family regulator
MCSPLGVACEYLTIRVSSSGMTVKVPVEEATRLGLRRPRGRQALHAALGVVPGEPADERSWKSRLRRNGERIATGDLGELVRLVCELSDRAQNRPLGLRERDQLTAARQQLLGEWMFAVRLDERAAAAALDDELASRAVTAA